MNALTLERKKEHLRYAKKLADLFSKDDSTKVGALILDPKFGEIIPYGTGYNGLPRGCDDNVPERKIRPEKYLWAEHAERNAIFNVARCRLENGTAILSYSPDIISARAVVSCGIKNVIIPFQETPTACSRVRAIFHEAKVNFITDEASLMHVGLRAEKMWKYAQLVEDKGRGAILLSHDERILGDVHDGFADNEDPARLAIYNVARRDTNGCILVATMMPCAECAEAIIKTGISSVITERPDIDRWNAHFDTSAEMFDRHGITCEILSPSNP